MDPPTPMNKPDLQSTTTRTSKTNILFGITGSVAAVKGPELVVKLLSTRLYNIQVVLTQGGYYFWNKAKQYDPYHWSLLQQFVENNNSNNNTTITPFLKIHSNNQDEWDIWNEMGDTVLHIELRNWSDLCIIAPLSAHTLAKLSNGLCDDTLSCVLRAWNFKTTTREQLIKPILVAPAMNTAMWDHPLTKQQLQTIHDFFPKQDDHESDNKNTTTTIQTSNNNMFHIIPPQSKTLACGEVGSGALASVDDILTRIDQVVIDMQK